MTPAQPSTPGTGSGPGMPADPGPSASSAPPTAPVSPRTALDLLFSAGEYPPAAIARHLSQALNDEVRDALDGLPETAREAAVRQVATRAAGLLSVGLPEVIVAGWRKHKDLTDAARRTLGLPGSTEVLDLASHRITASQEPYVTVLLDGQPVATIHFGLSFAADIGTLLATVEAGRLVALSAGRCEITVTLLIEGIGVVTRGAHLEPARLLSLRSGIRLLPARAYPIPPREAAGPGPEHQDEGE